MSIGLEEMDGPTLTISLKVQGLFLHGESGELLRKRSPELISVFSTEWFTMTTAQAVMYCYGIFALRFYFVYHLVACVKTIVIVCNIFLL